MYKHPTINYQPQHPHLKFKYSANRFNYAGEQCGQSWSLFSGYDNAIPCDYKDGVKQAIEYCKKNKREEMFKTLESKIELGFETYDDNGRSINYTDRITKMKKYMKKYEKNIEAFRKKIINIKKKYIENNAQMLLIEEQTFSSYNPYDIYFDEDEFIEYEEEEEELIFGGSDRTSDENSDYYFNINSLETNRDELKKSLDESKIKGEITEEMESKILKENEWPITELKRFEEDSKAYEKNKEQAEKDLVETYKQLVTNLPDLFLKPKLDYNIIVDTIQEWARMNDDAKKDKIGNKDAEYVKFQIYKVMFKLSEYKEIKEVNKNMFYWSFKPVNKYAMSTDMLYGDSFKILYVEENKINGVKYCKTNRQLYEFYKEDIPNVEREQKDELNKKQELKNSAIQNLEDVKNFIIDDTNKILTNKKWNNMTLEEKEKVKYFNVNIEEANKFHDTLKRWKDNYYAPENTLGYEAIIMGIPFDDDFEEKMISWMIEAEYDTTKYVLVREFYENVPKHKYYYHWVYKDSGRKVPTRDGNYETWDDALDSKIT